MKNSKKRTLLREAGWKEVQGKWNPPTATTMIYCLKEAWHMHSLFAAAKRANKRGWIPEPTTGEAILNKVDPLTRC